MRVMSWNVHSMRGADARCDPARIARVIEDARVDVAGLQEVWAPEAGGGSDPAERLARLTGLASAFGLTLRRHGGEFGNAILSRHPVEATRTYDLSVRGREPRLCIRADVATAATRVHFFDVHLGLHWRERRRQASQLLSADILRDTALSFPLVLVGDFNSWSSRAAVPRWLRRQLTDCAVEAGDESPTFPSRFPLLRLDRAYVDAAFQVEGVEVVRSRLARQASDHLPLVVDLALSPAARQPPAARPIETAGVVTTLRRDA